METENFSGTEEFVENQLLRESGSEAQSCSSSILNTPKRVQQTDSDSEDDITVTIEPSLEDEKRNDPSETDKDSKIKWRKNLSRGQRNKMRNLLKAGLSKEDARVQVLSKDVSVTPSSIKRSREGDHHSSGEKPYVKRTKSILCPKERAGISNCGIRSASKMEIDQSGKEGRTRGVNERPRGSTINLNSDGRSFKDVVSEVKVGIVLNGFPNQQMTTVQMDAVQDSLIMKIEQQRHEVVKPKFSKCSYRNGYLVISCKDQVTAEWLKDVTRSLSPWDNAELLAMDEKDIPRPELFHAFFPLSADYSNERLRALIESQNDGINTKGWKILSRSNVNKHAEWTVNMDEESLKILTERNFVLNYRFGETQLRRIKPQGNRQVDTKSNDERPHQTEKVKIQPSDSMPGTSGANMIASSVVTTESEGKTGDYPKKQKEKNFSQKLQDGLFALPTSNEERNLNQNETN